MAQDKDFDGAGGGENTDSNAEQGEARRPVGAGIGGDPGGPGGMGGVRGGMPNPDHRPNGGVSPIQHDQNDDRAREQGE